MPLNAKGSKIMASMQRQYGEKRGKSVFYASKNAGKISGVEQVASAARKLREAVFPHLKDVRRRG